MLPPSATAGVALRLTVVVCSVSLTAVVAAAGLTTSDSKLPPEAALIVAETLPASMYTSSLGAAILTVPLLVPAAMTIVAPLLRLTVTAVCATLVNDAVYVIAPPSATAGLAVSETVVVSIVSLIAVVAAVGSIASCSKLPPDVLEIVAETLPASMNTSSLGAATLTLPMLAPAAIVITAPLLNVTVIAVCAGAVSAAL